MNTERNPAGWFEIYVQDLERAKKFYENTLQMTLTRLETPDLGMPGLEMWAFPMLEGKPGCTGALVKMPGIQSGPGGTLLYFSCADCAVEANRAAQNGGTIQKPKFAIGDYGFITFVSDTEGNTIGLHSMQ